MLYNTILLQAGAGGTGGAFNPPFFILMGGMFIVMYFFMIRPQQKKANDQKKYLSELKKGDRVVTIGGIHGRIIKDNEDTLLIEVDNNVKLKIERSGISMENSKRVNDESGAKKEATPSSIEEGK